MLLLHYWTAEKVAAATRVFGTAVQKSLHAAGLAPEALKIVPVGRVLTNVEGKTLFECLRDNSLTKDDKKGICKQLKHLGEVLTNEGHVHGDLHSSNIIVAANNKLCVSPSCSESGTLSSAPHPPPTVCGVLAGPRLAPFEGAGGKTEKKLINQPEITLFLH